MASVTTRFGPYLPDLPLLGSAGSAVVENVLPVAGGYRPARSIAPVTGAASADVLAARFAISSAGTAFGFVGTASTLEQLVGTSFTDVSKSSGYSTAEDDSWDFAQAGDNVIATNYTDTIQVFDLSSDTEFDDIAGTPPKAKYLAVTGNFLVLAYLDEGGTIKPSGVRWSANNDQLSFPTVGSDTALQVLSDEQILTTDLGEVTGIQAGSNSADIVVFQEKAITAMNLIGGADIFSFDVLEGARGCPAPDSIVTAGGLIYYLTEDGLYRTDGVSVVGIGSSKVDRFIYTVLDTSVLYNVQATADFREKLLFWTLPTEDASEDLTLVYNYDIEEFSLVNGLGIRAFTRAVSTSLTLEAIATQFGGLDTMPGSLDDAQWKGGGIPVFSAVDETNQIGPFTGETLGATLKTPEAELIEDGRAYLAFTRPLIDTDQVKVRAVVREIVDDDPQRKALVDVSAGAASHRVSGRYFALEAVVQAGADWNFAQGIQAVYEPAGARTAGDIVPTFTVPLFLLREDGLALLNLAGQPLIADVAGVVIEEDVDLLVTLGGEPLVTLVGSEPLRLL